MRYQCDIETFLNDVKTHEIKIIRDDGCHHHIRYSTPGSFAFWFELITWENCLCITGDCGTYVFRRARDMFRFFRSVEPFCINPPYWGEKLEAIDTNGGYKEFDPLYFQQRVIEHVEDFYDGEPDEEKKACMEEVEAIVLSRVEEGEHAAYTAVNDFERKDFRFVDFFDGGAPERYTFRYIWCLYAIVWGIDRYDRVKEATV